MFIRNLLDQGHSKENTQTIIRYIGSDEDRMAELMACIFSEDYRLCQRASWPLGFIAETKPELIVPFMGSLLKNLDKPNHDAVVRNTIRAWGFMDIPEEFSGVIYEKCYGYLADPNYPIAIRVFSMTVCANICKQYPELTDELLETISTYYTYGSAGFKSRARKIKKQLKKVKSASLS